ncbi:hypothetical protein MNB_SM-4-396 [hydrothermal vent metagenome]|uniref:DUF4168 domain-containing protein n=1 Tax=hydrothermal vent metagenome TaxID=652676 RepID=A0A1W1BJW5_9ZZZZ
MKAITLTLVLLGGLTLGLADATDTQTNEKSLQTQERIQNMNEMKEKISLMTPEAREIALQEMSKHMSSDMQNSVYMGEDKQAQIKEYAGEMQMQNIREITQDQNMNQQQVANQYDVGVSRGTYTKDGTSFSGLQGRR